MTTVAMAAMFGGATADAAPRPKLQIINASDDAIEVFWIRPDGERMVNGSIAPGEETTIDTTIGHRFAIVDHRAGTEKIVTSEVTYQAFRYDPPSDEGIPAFYTQVIHAKGFPIVASANVNPFALKEAEYILEKMLGSRPDVREAMIKSGARLCIVAHNELTTDLPEWAHLAQGWPPDKNMRTISAKTYWDVRGRGMGGSQTDPYCICAEENILGFPGDPYEKECILIHEFAHSIHLRGMVNVDPTFDDRLKETYDKAMAAGLWKGKYASVNHHEYFAEGVQSWFDDNRENDHDHNWVNTRVELIEYDPGLAAMCKEVFGETKFSYSKPATRLVGHLTGYDPSKAPQYKLPERLEEARALIRQAARDRDAKANAAGKSEK
ncbi:MAG: hypothetical protein GC159_03745 [Phycisphaera sp.]|nr:hypothetical protein [Phycisphaera sp.]